MKGLLVLAVIAAGVALLYFATLRQAGVECEVCVEFNGRRNCATASASTEGQAVQSAQSTACGTISSGMAESVLCGDEAPVSRQCRTR